MTKALMKLLLDFNVIVNTQREVNSNCKSATTKTTTNQELNGHLGAEMAEIKVREFYSQPGIHPMFDPFPKTCQLLDLLS